jgi:site-specific DNA-methyltransferase (cytosine-N4-specific)
MMKNEKLPINTVLLGDIAEVVKELPDNSVNCIVTSPPYFGLRDYQTSEWEGGDSGCDHKPGNQSRANGSTLTGGHNHGGHLLEGYKGEYCPKCGATRIDKQIGLEETPEEYVQKLVEIFRELKRVLRDDGTCWLNLGDSYSGNGNKTGEGEKRALQTETFHGGTAHLEQRLSFTG